LTSLFPPLHVHDIMCTATFADCTSISSVLGIKSWLWDFSHSYLCTMLHILAHGHGWNRLSSQKIAT